MRSKLPRMISVVVAGAVMAAMLWAGIRALDKEYVFWNGILLPKHEQQVSIAGKRMRNPNAFLKFTDLRKLDARDTGMTLQQYAWLRQKLPECQVLWDVPIQGSRYGQDTRKLAVEGLTDEEIDGLAYLPCLELVDVGQWADYARIGRIRQEYPYLTVRYQVTICEEQWDSDVASLILEDADPQELMEKLQYFENLESVLLTGEVPDQKELILLQVQYPEVFFLWKMDVLGMSLETDMEYWDLSDVKLENVETLEHLLPYFPNLKTVRLDSNELSQDDLVAMAIRHPEIQFAFQLEFAGNILPTDAEEIDISNTQLENTQRLEEVLPCFRNLKKVVMCGCGISDEEMDSLNRRYEDIRFVWSVNLAGKLLRTDAVYFTPNKWGISCDDANIYALRYCTDMVCVDIGHHVKVTSCDWVRYMPELKYLIIAETGISDLSPLENHKKLIYLELFLSRVTDYSVLTTCRALEDLNLCYTQGDPVPIGEMTWLKRLWWSGSWAGRMYLADKLPDTYTEYLSLSSTGRGWREGQHYYDMRDFIGMDYMVG